MELYRLFKVMAEQEASDLFLKVGTHPFLRLNGKLIPAGELTEAELREMAQQPDKRAPADLMLAWRLPYARALAGALQARRDGTLSEVETRLNQLRYREALAQLGEEANDLLVREMLQAEIDMANLTTLLRLGRLRARASDPQTRYGGADAMPLLIDGGGFPRRVLEDLSAVRDVESIARELKGTPYQTVLSGRMERYRQSGDVFGLARALEGLLMSKGVGMFHRDPLSVAIPIGYIWAKSNEVANLRLIAQGKALGWDWEAIRDQLIWWVRE
jgi:V/A-type H+-transporting ATPase subunit C